MKIESDLKQVSRQETMHRRRRSIEYRLTGTHALTGGLVAAKTLLLNGQFVTLGVEDVSLTRPTDIPVSYALTSLTTAAFMVLGISCVAETMSSRECI